VDAVRLAIVGCGAVVDKFYLPALGRSPLLKLPPSRTPRSSGRAAWPLPIRASSSPRTTETSSDPWKLRWSHCRTTCTPRRDDALGGVEANCELELTLQSGVSGVVELSRTRTLRNSCIIRGERGTLEIGTNPTLRLTPIGAGIPLAGRGILDGPNDTSFPDTFARQLTDFAEAIRCRRRPFVTGEDGSRAIALVEACYRSRQRLPQVWMTPVPGTEPIS